MADDAAPLRADDQPDEGNAQARAHEDEQGLPRDFSNEDLAKAKGAWHVRNDGFQTNIENAHTVNNIYQIYGAAPIAAKPDGEGENFDLSTSRGIAAFFEQGAGGYPLALVIVMGVVSGALPRGALTQAAKALQEMLPAHWDGETQARVERRGAYTSQEAILANLGAETGDMDVWGPYGRASAPGVILSDGDMRERIRSCLWFSYPLLRKPVVFWLIAYTREKDLLLADSASQALGELALMDMSFAQRDIIPEMIARHCPTRALSIAVSVLYDNPASHPAAEAMYKNWSQSALWRVPILSFAHAPDPAREGYARDAFYHRIKLWVRGADVEGEEFRGDVAFLAQVLLYKRALQMPLAKGFNDLFCERGERDYEVASLFLLMLAECYLRVDVQKGRLPFVAVCEEDEHKPELMALMRPIYRQIVGNSRLLGLMWNVLRAYIAELDAFGMPPEQLFRFFRSIAFTGRRYDWDQISAFLRRRIETHKPSATAQRIYTWLCGLKSSWEEKKKLSEGRAT